MHKVYLGIGGNTGNKKKNQKKCLELIRKNIGAIKIYSSIYDTPPWGFESENYFWNQVVMVSTELLPHELLVQIQKIEHFFGRERTSTAYSSREMDVDILFFDDFIVQTEDLTIPHPHIHKRKFVLVPMVEISPEEIHPVFGKSMEELLRVCTDLSPIKRI